MSLITFSIWRYNVELDKKWKLIGHILSPVSISDPTVGESAYAAGDGREQDNACDELQLWSCNKLTQPVNVNIIV